MPTMRHPTLARITAALAAALALAPCSVALAGPKQDRAAVAKLEELYAPIGKLAGAERVNRACADAAKLQAALTFSDEHAPDGASVGDDSWGARARAVEGSIGSLVDDCKAPDHKRKLINSVESADDVVAALDGEMRALLDAAKHRALPAALITLRKTYQTTKLGKGFCAQAKKLAKQVGAVAAPPPGVDGPTWTKAYAAVKTGIDGLTCTKTAEPDEAVGSALNDLRDQLDALVLLVPPS